MTRWHGITRLIGLEPLAAPTARTADGAPIIAAIERKDWWFLVEWHATGAKRRAGTGCPLVRFLFHLTPGDRPRNTGGYTRPRLAHNRCLQPVRSRNVASEAPPRGPIGPRTRARIRGRLCARF